MIPRMAVLAVAAALLLSNVPSAEPAPAPAPAAPKDPLRVNLENALKHLKDLPKPQKSEDLPVFEQTANAAIMQIAGLGDKAPETLLEMATENVRAVPAHVLVKVLQTQPKRSGEWIERIGACMQPGGKGKSYRSLEDVLLDGEYWCFVLNDLKDPAAIKYLAPLLQFRSGPVGKVILELSEKQGSLDAIEKYLKDEKSDPKQRAEFVIMLSYSSRPDLAVPVLRNALKDKDLEVRQEAVQALGFLGLDGQEAPDEFKWFLNDEDPKLRRWTARSCVALGLFDHTPHLIPLLKDENESLREEARELLTAMVGQDFGGSVEDWNRWWNQVGSQFPARLRKCLSDRPTCAMPQDKINLMKALVDIVMLRDRQIEATANGWILDAESEVRIQACKVFMAMPPRMPSLKGLSLLVELLRDENATVVQAAHMALLKHSPSALPAEYAVWKDWLLRRNAPPDAMKMMSMAMWGFRPKELPLNVQPEALDVVAAMPSKPMPRRTVNAPSAEAVAAAKSAAEAPPAAEAEATYIPWGPLSAIAIGLAVIAALAGAVYSFQKRLQRERESARKLGRAR
ncbi:MAG: HEAT repeat domain-containing protein [Planctomycetota bacterium]|nr:HEAT repeat domain-containing protein [Planctomycetota bacterium]